jgi:hypothetical protein
MWTLTCQSKHFIGAKLVIRRHLALAIGQFRPACVVKWYLDTAYVIISELTNIGKHPPWSDRKFSCACSFINDVRAEKNSRANYVYVHVQRGVTSLVAARARTFTTINQSILFCIKIIYMTIIDYMIRGLHTFRTSYACARHIRESDANVAHTCRARSVQQGRLLFNPPPGYLHEHDQALQPGTSTDRHHVILRTTCSEGSLLKWSIVV